MIFLSSGEQHEVNEVIGENTGFYWIRQTLIVLVYADAEATSKKGTHIAKFAIQEWKNACKMNFSGVFTHLEPNSEYKLFVTKDVLPDDEECPPNLLNMESTEFGKVCSILINKQQPEAHFTSPVHFSVFTFHFILI